MELLEKNPIMIKPNWVGDAATIYLVVSFIILVVVAIITYKMNSKLGVKIMGFTGALIIIILLVSVVIIDRTVPDVESEYYKYTYRLDKEQCTVQELQDFFDKYNVESYEDGVLTVYDKDYETNNRYIGVSSVFKK